MPTESLLLLAALVVLLAAAGLGRHFAASPFKRNALSVLLVVLALATAFLLFYTAGAWFRSNRMLPAHALASSPLPKSQSL